MLINQDITRLNITCEDFNIPKPKTLTDAETLHKAAVALQTEVYAEVEPNSYDLTVKNLRALHAALVSWPSHDSRGEAANLLAQRANGYVMDEWNRFAHALLVGDLLRSPFNKAAAAYTGGDETALPALIALAQTRDILASANKATTLRTDNLDPQTRILDVVSARHALYVVTHATQGLERFAQAWFEAVRDLDGVTIRWMSPADQVAQDKALPQEMRDREGVKVKA
jgi:hypothetical protein